MVVCVAYSRTLPLRTVQTVNESPYVHLLCSGHVEEGRGRDSGLGPLFSPAEHGLLPKLNKSAMLHRHGPIIFP